MYNSLTDGRADMTLFEEKKSQRTRPINVLHSSCFNTECNTVHVRKQRQNFSCHQKPRSYNDNYQKIISVFGSNTTVS